MATAGFFFHENDRFGQIHTHLTVSPSHYTRTYNILLGQCQVHFVTEAVTGDVPDTAARDGRRSAEGDEIARSIETIVP
jgi:hypothetical protein